MIILSVIGGFLTLMALFLIVPWGIRVKVSVYMDQVSYYISLRPPLFPLYLKVLTSDALRSRTSQRASSRKGRSENATGERVGTDRGQRESRESVMDRVKRIHAAVDQVAGFIRSTVPGIIGAFRVVEFSLKGQLGTGDAYYTALLSGGLTAALNAAIGFARQRGLRVETKPHIYIAPDFSLDPCLRLEGLFAADFQLMRLFRAAGHVSREIRQLKSCFTPLSSSSGRFCSEE